MIAAEIASRHVAQAMHAKRAENGDPVPHAHAKEGGAKHGFLHGVDTEVAGMDEAEEAIAAALKAKPKKKEDEEEVEEEEDEEENSMLILDAQTSEYYWVQKYLDLAKFCRHFVINKWFSGFIFVCIGAAGIVVGMQTYPQFEESEQLVMVDYVILVAFSLELILKIVGEGLNPLHFFSLYNKEYKWNWFDAFIVVFSLPWLPFGGGGQLKLLRLVRLMRLTKLFKRIPQLNMIMRGLIDSMNFVSYIVLLWFLVIYLYAITGILLFAKNDPWHFRSIEYSFITLFQVTVMDYWGEAMYVNYYGCAEYPSEFYTNDARLGGNEVGDLMLCENPMPQPGLTLVYFISYVTITAFCIIPLFIGAVSISMADCVVEMKEEQLRQHREQCLEKLELQIDKLDHPARMDRKMKKAVRLVGLAFRGHDITTEFVTYEVGGWMRTQYMMLSHMCGDIIEANNVQLFITLVIVLAGIVVGMQTDKLTELRFKSELNLLNDLIQYVFTWELAMKLIAEGEHPYMYFNSGWNIFDFIVVAGSYLPLSNGSMVIILRLLRLFRVLKLMKALPQLQVIITGASKGLSAAGYILVIVTICYYFFAILGNALFASNDPATWGQIHVGMIILMQMATLDNWTTYYYTTIFGCEAQPAPTMFDQERQCKHPEPQFLLGTIYFAIFTIFGSYVLLALFVGSIGMAMDEANEEQAEVVRVQKRVKHIQKNLNMTDAAVNNYHDVFKMVDITNTNRIARDELKFGLRIAGEVLAEAEFERLWKKVDKDATQDIDFSEFLTFMLDMRELYLEQLKEAADSAAGSIVDTSLDTSEGRKLGRKRSAYGMLRVRSFAGPFASTMMDEYDSDEERARENAEGQGSIAFLRGSIISAVGAVASIFGGGSKKANMNTVDSKLLEEIAKSVANSDNPSVNNSFNPDQENATGAEETKQQEEGGVEIFTQLSSTERHADVQPSNPPRRLAPISSPLGEKRGEVEMHDMSPSSATNSAEKHEESAGVVVPDTTPVRNATDGTKSTPTRVNNYMNSPQESAQKPRNESASSPAPPPAEVVTPIRFFNDYNERSPAEQRIQARNRELEAFDEEEKRNAQNLRKKKYHVINVPTTGNRKVKIMAI